MDSRESPELIGETDSSLTAAGAANRPRFKLRIIPATILCFVGGLFFVTGFANLILLVFWPENSRAQASFIPAPAAGALWVLSGYMILNARWWWAIATAVCGYFVGLLMEFL